MTGTTAFRADAAWRWSRYWAPPLTAVAFVLLRRQGLIAPVPLWSLLLVLAQGAILSMLAEHFWADKMTGARLHVRIALDVLAVTFIIYATGWGPTLAVGYLFVAVVAIRSAGSRAARPSIAWSLAGFGAGQAAIATGWAQSFVPVPAVHGLAGLAAFGCSYVIHLLGASTGEKEYAELSLRDSEQRFRSLVQNASDVIAVVDADAAVSYVSPAVEQVLGYTPEQYRDTLGFAFVHPDDLPGALDAFRRTIESPEQTVCATIRARHADGSWRWIEVRVQNRMLDPAVQGIVANITDVSERKEAEERLAYHAFNDTLTRLPNRAALADALERALARTRRHSQKIAVLFLDLDGFKVTNDSLGHEAGDRLLVAVADRLRSCLRPEDTLARLGGDEFTVVLEEIADASDAARAADRILDELRAPFRVSGREVYATASIGIVVGDGDDASPADLLRHADLAMYAAKDKGRARWEMFDVHTAKRVLDRLEMEGDLRAAVEQDQFGVAYQPEVCLRTGRIVAIEALARWRHPVRGMVGPGEFVPVAEDIGAILPLGRFVLREACAVAATWDEGAKPVRVSVNLSPRWLRQDDAVEQVAAILHSSELPPHRLQIEVTEHLALAQGDAAVETLGALKALGVHLAIDDFGTGYSSLSYLSRLPVDVVKLDRSFVEGLTRGTRNAALVEAVIGLGHALGMRVTAEGVEEERQVRELVRLGCDSAQGFWFGAPMPSQEIPAVLERAMRAPGHGRARPA